MFTGIVEEIGILDHLTGGRLEIGTAVGVPQELTRLGIDMTLAREINDESLEILDKALATGVVTHHGKHFHYDNLRLAPRPAQAPPPKWTTVVSEESARKSARRGAKISTGFNATWALLPIPIMLKSSSRTVFCPSKPKSRYVGKL